MAEADDECLFCDAEDLLFSDEETTEKWDADVDCPASAKDCGHHCNHSMSHDQCCWCHTMWGEGGVRTHAEAA